MKPTEEVTHRTSPDADAERSLILADLVKINRVGSTRWIEGFHKELQGRSGGAPWHTDDRLPLLTVAVGAT